MSIEPVGVDDSGDHAGQMSLPSDPALAGWYRFGPAPLDPTGAVVVAAHADRVGHGPGPLARLDRMDTGDLVVLRVGKRDVTYRIERVELVAKDRLNVSALFDSTGSARLHLISCGGTFDSKQHSYDANVVATGVRVE